MDLVQINGRYHLGGKIGSGSFGMSRIAMILIYPLTLEYAGEVYFAACLRHLDGPEHCD